MAACDICGGDNCAHLGDCLRSLAHRVNALESDSSDTTDDLERRVTSIERAMDPTDPDREDPRQVGYGPAPTVTLEQKLTLALLSFKADDHGWTSAVEFRRVPDGIHVSVGLHSATRPTAREGLVDVMASVESAKGELWPGCNDQPAEPLAPVQPSPDPVDF